MTIQHSDFHFIGHVESRSSGDGLVWCSLKPTDGTWPTVAPPYPYRCSVLQYVATSHKLYSSCVFDNRRVPQNRQTVLRRLPCLNIYLFQIARKVKQALGNGGGKRSHRKRLHYQSLHTCFVPLDFSRTLQHTAAHCNTLQHTAIHCNTLQHACFVRYMSATH